MALLNKLYTAFDDIMDRNGVCKIETVGGTYMGMVAVLERTECATSMESARSTAVAETVKAAQAQRRWNDSVDEASPAEQKAGKSNGEYLPTSGTPRQGPPIPGKGDVEAVGQEKGKVADQSMNFSVDELLNTDDPVVISFLSEIGLQVGEAALQMVSGFSRREGNPCPSQKTKNKLKLIKVLYFTLSRGYSERASLLSFYLYAS